MHVQNLEAGLRQAMKAVFVAAGLSSSAAEAKIAANLAAADALFHEKHRESTHKQRPNSPTAAMAYAMRAVVAWARTL